MWFHHWNAAISGVEFCSCWWCTCILLNTSKEQLRIHHPWGRMLTWAFLVLLCVPKERKGLLLSLRTAVFLSCIGCKGEREDLSLVRKAEDWWWQHRGTTLCSNKLSSHSWPSHLHLLPKDHTAPPCWLPESLWVQIRSSEEHQHVLVFTWQSRVAPHPSTSPRCWLSSLELCRAIEHTEQDSTC